MVIVVIDIPARADNVSTEILFKHADGQWVLGGSSAANGLSSFDQIVSDVAGETKNEPQREAITLSDEKISSFSSAQVVTPDIRGDLGNAK